MGEIFLRLVNKFWLEDIYTLCPVGSWKRRFVLWKDEMFPFEQKHWFSGSLTCQFAVSVSQIPDWGVQLKGKCFLIDTKMIAAEIFTQFWLVGH